MAEKQRAFPLELKPPRTSAGAWEALRLQARLTGEVFQRLGWSIPRSYAGLDPLVTTRRNTRQLFAPTHAQLLAIVERAEVERRTRVYEREATRDLAEACGWRLVAAQQHRWRAEHQEDSRRVLVTTTSEQLRVLLRMTRPDPAPEVPWGAADDVQEVTHAA